MYEPRFYRQGNSKKLKKFNVCYKETDLLVYAPLILSEFSYREIRKLRLSLEDFIEKNPLFARSLNPLSIREGMSLEIIDMVKASAKVGVGPMAAVAGVFAESLAKKVLKKTDQVIVENGGDIFLKLKEDTKIGIFAGKDSPFSNKLAIAIKAKQTALGICTSSGTMGPSLSKGKADIATVISKSAALADAAATAVANKVQDKDDIPNVLDWVKDIEGIKGVLIIKDDKIGVWGELELSKV